MTTTLKTHGDLPWEAAPPSGILTRALDTAVRNIPSVGEHYANQLRLRAEQGIKGLDQGALTFILSVVVTGAAMGYSFYLQRSLQPFGARYQVWRPRREGSKLASFGQIGMLLDSALGPGPASSSMPVAPRFVETDTEVD